MSDATFGVGVVGTGAVFGEHADAIGRLASRLRLVGVAEPDEHRRRAATDATFVPYATNDHRDLVEHPEVDIVVVCTPPAAHEDIVRDALAAGKRVVCEKPLACDLAAIDRLIDVASPTPGRLSTVYQWRYRPEVRRMIHLVDRDRLGRLLLARFQRFGGVPAGQDVAGWWGRWDRAGGGAVMTQAIHELDLMLHLFGPVAEVRAELATLALPIESEDTAFVSMRFVSGAVGLLTTSAITHDKGATQFDVIGEEASVHFPWRLAARDERVRRQLLAEALDVAAMPGRMNHPDVMRVRNRLRRVSPRFAPPRSASMHAPYWREVVDALDAGAPMPVGPVEARRSVELVTAIYTSALERRAVALPLPDQSRFRHGVTAADYAAAPVTVAS